MDDLTEFKCPNCGGAVEFNSAGQNMKCPYCDAEFDINGLKEYSDVCRQETGDDIEWRTSGAEWSAEDSKGMKVYTCRSCGGQIVADETTAASACPYCDNPIVMTGQFEGGSKPDLVIPFKIDKKQAEAALKQHLKGKFLLPKSFSSDSRIEEIKGLYVPFWLFDCDAEAHTRYKATRIRTWISGNYTYTETSHYLVTRDGEISFDKVPADGSSKMPDDFSQSVEPYRYADCMDFTPAYLAGYLADKYDVESEQCAQTVNLRIHKSTEDVFRGTVQGYASVVQESANIRLKRGQALYALMPVWVLSTNYHGQIYRFAMNGQTGKFVGDLPVDKGRFWGLFAAITAAVTAISFRIMSAMSF